MARRAIPQRTNSQHAAPNLTTNSGSPNRSNTGDPLMPYQSLALRGHVASGNAMEIYGLPRGADAAIPTHVRNLLGWTPSLLRRSALYPIASLSYRLRLPDIDVQAGSRTLGPRRVYLVLSQFHECLRWLQRCVSWGNICPGLSSRIGTLGKFRPHASESPGSTGECTVRERPTPAPAVTTVPPRRPSLQVDKPKAYLPSRPWPMIYSTLPSPGPRYPVPTTCLRGARFMTHLFPFTVSACQVCPTSMRPTNWARAYLAGLA